MPSRSRLQSTVNIEITKRLYGHAEDLVKSSMSPSRFEAGLPAIF